MMHSPTQPTDHATQGATGNHEPAMADAENQVVGSTSHRDDLIRIIDELDRAIASWD